MFFKGKRRALDESIEFHSKGFKPEISSFLFEAKRIGKVES